MKEAKGRRRETACPGAFAASFLPTVQLSSSRAPCVQRAVVISGWMPPRRCCHTHGYVCDTGVWGALGRVTLCSPRKVSEGLSSAPVPVMGKRPWERGGDKNITLDPPVFRQFWKGYSLALGLARRLL